MRKFISLLIGILFLPIVYAGCTSIADDTWGQYFANNSANCGDMSPNHHDMVGHNWGSGLYYNASNTPTGGTGSYAYKSTGYHTINTQWDWSQPQCVWAWAYFGTPTSDEYMLGDQSDGNQFLFSENGWGIRDDSQFKEPAFTPSADTWYFLGYCHDGTMVRLYRDGNPVAEDTEAFPVDTDDIGPGMVAGPIYSADMHISALYIIERNMTQAEITALYNGGEVCNIFATDTPSPHWQGYTEYNNTRQNYGNWTFFYNVTQVAPQNCSLYNVTTKLTTNTTAIAVNTKYNFTYELAEGHHELYIRCDLDGATYNTSVKYITKDITEPPLDFINPLEDNSTVITNGTTTTIHINGSDENLDGFNNTGYYPDGSTIWFLNYTDNITTDYYDFKRTLLVDKQGTFTIEAIWWDDHNDLTSDYQKERVANYNTQLTPNGKVLKAFENDISMTSTHGTIDISYNGESWSQSLEFSETLKAGSKVSITVQTTKPLRRKYTEHQCHLISHWNAIDFDGIAADCEASQIDKNTYKVYLTLLEDTKKIIAYSVDEMNINTKFVSFYSNCKPELIIENQTVNVSSWSYFVNVSDCDNTSFGYSVNVTNPTINESGYLEGTFYITDNGILPILINVSDGFTSDVEIMYLNISVTTPINITINQTLITGVCPSTIPDVMILWMFVILACFFIAIGMTTEKSISGVLGAVMLWPISWITVACHSFMSLILALTGIVLFVYFMGRKS